MAKQFKSEALVAVHETALGGASHPWSLQPGQ